MQMSARSIHPIQRSNLYNEVINLYNKDSNVVNEYPLEVRFVGKTSVDQGGLSRDMLSGLWEKAYGMHFDGGSLLAPCVRPDMDVSLTPVLGRIISHGYLATGFLPLRITFPSLVSILLGPTVTIPDQFLIQAFKNNISCYEASIVKEAPLVKSASYEKELRTRIVSVVSRFECTEMPNPTCLRQLIVNIAKCEFLSKPFAALSMMNTGIAPEYRKFWEQNSVFSLYEIVNTLQESADKVIAVLECVPMNKDEQRTFNYLEMFIGNMSRDVPTSFLWFVTVSSVCSTNKIEVTSNTLRGLGQRPISSTCDCSLELLSTYGSYVCHL